VFVAAALALPALVVVAGPASARGRLDHGNPEARRVDRVPTPDLDWFDCSQLTPDAWCATATLPLDYDRPRGATTEVAMLKLEATDPEHKIGTLFLNPGGPAVSGIMMAAQARTFLSDSVRARFDVVGFDPRGTNFSSNVTCWENMGEQTEAIKPILTQPFPWTEDEEADFVAASKRFGRACSTTGRPLSAHMSTAEVARDMDVMRRAVGDPKLSYLGFSYGTYLGNVYANMFPDRFRVLALDGIVDPDGWVGTPQTANTPMWTRMKSPEAASRAMDEALDRCAQAGPEACEFADRGDPKATYAAIMSSLQKAPLEWQDPADGTQQSLSYEGLTSALFELLYAPDAAERVTSALTDTYDLMQPAADPGTEGAQRQESARGDLHAALQQDQAAADQASDLRETGAKLFGAGFPYNNGQEAQTTVMCTDGLHARDAAAWPRYAAAADARWPHFGRGLVWTTSSCASDTWTVRDQDAYRGPFNHRTAAPVLVVGNLWDPITNYDNAVKVSRQLPNARLLSADNWGHLAYGKSACATDAIDTYLLTQQLPADGTMCNAQQPFTPPTESTPPAGQRQLPPAVQMIPGIVPR
jgi:pimeloyl-ACP methyl ester carboxylesterase